MKELRYTCNDYNKKVYSDKNYVKCMLDLLHLYGNWRAKMYGGRNKKIYTLETFHSADYYTNSW